MDQNGYLHQHEMERNRLEREKETGNQKPGSKWFTAQSSNSASAEEPQLTAQFFFLHLSLSLFPFFVSLQLHCISQVTLTFLVLFLFTVPIEGSPWHQLSGLMYQFASSTEKGVNLLIGETPQKGKQGGCNRGSRGDLSHGGSFPEKV